MSTACGLLVRTGLRDVQVKDYLGTGHKKASLNGHLGWNQREVQMPTLTCINSASLNYNFLFYETEEKQPILGMMR